VWERLLELQAEGLTREVGVSNYSVSQIDELQRAIFGFRCAEVVGRALWCHARDAYRGERPNTSGHTARPRALCGRRRSQAFDRLLSSDTAVTTAAEARRLLADHEETES
jgi:hypothetical protein